MSLKGNYTIHIEIVNDESGQRVGVKEKYSSEKLDKLVSDAKEWIQKYDNVSFMPCYQCRISKHEEEMSSPEPIDDAEDEIKDLKFCQDCLEEILTGSKKVDL